MGRIANRSQRIDLPLIVGSTDGEASRLHLRFLRKQRRSDGCMGSLGAEQQDWVLHDTVTEVFCRECDGETSLIEVELRPANA